MMYLKATLQYFYQFIHFLKFFNNLEISFIYLLWEVEII